MARLRLYQLVSPALPVGAFSYSEGLEVLVQRGELAEVAGLEGWLTAELERGLVAIEAAALAPLMAALSRGDLAAAGELDGWLLVQREAAEVRAQQRQMGRSLLQLLAELGWPLPGPEGPPVRGALGWSAAWAWAGVCLELEPLELIEAYLHGWVANQISAAVRLVPLGATSGQALQLRLGPLLERRARELVGADPRALWSGGVGAALAQLHHAELYSRLFRS
ncbi:urease accessory protein UreF [Cyanobium sp. Morenito 9A2]|uniref:urease accessory protein UreF n=1 Tax=Cyanobium sp. Morenito 9A2 TaxID=2823718 RepID=UPI0020CEF452|nr:urease accessory UreF family protein [Cyanobium sp. Morenito 9A2]MCP9850471.1 urease accessory protein UreF [Cyanobium sp. Morenito 9A2]